jgi:hypothetical protein
MPGSPTSSVTWAPQAGRLERGPQLLHLLVAADDRQHLLGLLLGEAGDGADAVGRDRPLLTLDEERLGDGLERRARALEHLGGGEDLAELGACGQPGGQVDGVAHQGIGAPGARAYIAGEGRAAIDAGAESQRRLGVEDRANGPQHPLLVGPRARGRTGGQIELAAVDVDVRLEERDPELRRHPADERAEPGERLVHGSGPALSEQGLDAGELEEAGRDLAVLGLAGFEAQVGAESDGHVRLEVGRRRRWSEVLDDGRGGGVRVGVDREQGRATPLACEPLRAERRGGGWADEDLARSGGVLELDRGRRGGPSDDEFLMARLDEEEVTTSPSRCRSTCGARPRRPSSSSSRPSAR